MEGNLCSSKRIGRHSLHSRIIFNTRVVSTERDTDEQLYHIFAEDSTTGVKMLTNAHILISAVGFLDIPRLSMEINGFLTFKGSIFHSACWNYNINLRGKCVAVAGNGASA